MSKFSSKLSQLQVKEQRILAKKSALICKWKKRVGDIGEKANMTALPDAAIAGIFIEAQATLKNNPQQIKAWEESGKVFLKSRRGSSLSIATEKNFGKHPSHPKANIEG